MARFPTREREVTTLAIDLIEGITKNSEVFPTPPVSPEELREALQTYRDAREAAATAAGAAKDAYGIKDDALEDLTDAMKANIKYAEATANGTERELRLVGWSGRSGRKPLEKPGPAVSLEVLRSGKGWVFLNWKQPGDGGDVAAYKVQCTRPEEGVWKNVGTAVETELLVNNQERGVDLLFRVIGINRVGQGDPSNSVRVVL